MKIEESKSQVLTIKIFQMGAKTKENGHIHNHIAIDTNITGDINSKGDLRIDGHISGTIVSEGKIVIGQDGFVEGKIKCKNADIAGEVKADIEVTDLIVLKETSVMTGNILTQKISIEPGAQFTGNCTMGNSNTATAKDGKKQK